MLKPLALCAITLLAAGPAVADTREILKIYSRHAIAPAPIAASGAPDEETLIRILRLRDPYLQILPATEPTPKEPAGRFGIRLSLVGETPVVAAHVGTAAAQQIDGIMEVLTINGQPTGPDSDLSRFASADRLVLLVREGPDAPPRDVVLMRSAGTSKAPIEVTWRNGMRVLRFHEFKAGETADALGKAVSDAAPNEPVVLDLRLNSGGSLFEALDAASIFISPGLKIADTVITGGEREAYYSTDRPDRQPHRPLVLLISDHTASAAESFVRALDHYGRALVAGTRSFGKCRSQVRVPLSDGRLLSVSNMRLLGLDGSECEGEPVDPVLPIVPPTLYQLDEVVARISNAFTGKKALNYVCVRPKNEDQDAGRVAMEIAIAFDQPILRAYSVHAAGTHAVCLGPMTSVDAFALELRLDESYPGTAWTVALEEFLRQDDVGSLVRQ